MPLTRAAYPPFIGIERCITPMITSNLKSSWLARATANEPVPASEPERPKSRDWTAKRLLQLVLEVRDRHRGR